MTLPTGFTLARLASVGAFLIATWAGPGARAWGVTILGLGALTDALDGFLARRIGRRTPLGAVLDPLADKVWVTAALVALVLSGTVAPWAPALIVLRELVVAVRRAQLARCGVPLPSTLLSKAKTFSQMTVLWAMLAFPRLPDKEGWVWVLVAVTWASAVDLLRDREPKEGVDPGVA